MKILKLLYLKVKKLKIKDFFKVTTGKRFTEEDVYLNTSNDNIPCITSQTSNYGIAWNISEEWLIKNTNHLVVTTPCVTWTKDGVYAGTLFYRDYTFCPNDHCGVLILKSEYVNKINLKWFVYTQQDIIKKYVSQSNTQPMLYNEIMSEIEINLPIDLNSDIDIAFQNDFVERFEKISKETEVYSSYLSQLSDLLKYEIKLENCASYKIDQLCLLNKGSNKISEEMLYLNHDSNGVPVYSSAVLKDGLMGRVSKTVFDKFEKKGSAGELTWTTNGNAGVVFIRNDNYLYSEKCGRMQLRTQYVGRINLKYVQIVLNQITSKFRTAESNNGKLEILHMSNIEIPIPIMKSKEIDIKTQNYIVALYEEIENTKKLIKSFKTATTDLLKNL